MRIRDQNELEIALEIQLSATQASCAGFDAGNRWEAIRLATAICTIVHDAGKNYVSILAQLNVKAGIKFLASGQPVDPHNLAACTPLVMFEVTPHGARYLPMLGEAADHRLMCFDEWWDRDFIFRSGDGAHRLTRKKLTLDLRNLEGGGHLNKRILDPNYIALTHGRILTMVWSDGSETPLRELELATMRQIAWEVLESLKLAGFNL